MREQKEELVMRSFLILPILLFSLSVFASSKWEFVVENTSKDTYYIDSNSYQKSGDSITYWQLRNYWERDRHGDLSSKIQYTINCRTREIIGRYLMSYDDRNNFGKVTTNTAVNDTWSPIAPDTISWDIMKHVCK